LGQQSHLAKVQNCSEDTSAFVFISELRITHPLYKYLVKYNVTRWSEVIYRPQPYIQLEEAMKVFANLSFHRDNDETKLKPPHGGPLLTSRDTDMVLSRNNRSRTLSRANLELIKYLTISPC